MSCSNNLKQIGLPSITITTRTATSRLSSVTRGRLWSFLVTLLLPYFEQDNLYRQFDFKGAYSPHTGLVYWGTNEYNGALLSGKASKVQFCPSSPLPKWALVGSVPGTGILSSTYVGISGAVDHPSTVDRDGETYEHYGKGKCSSGGMLISHDTKKFADMTDGTTTTLLVGEQSDYCRNSLGQKVDCRSDFGHGFAMGPGWPARTGTGTYVRALSLERQDVGEQGRGRSLLRPEPALQSVHPGGAWSLFGDGSVRFLKDSLPIQMLYNMANRDDGQVVNE